MTDTASPTSGLLAGKTFLVMGVANKWSIAYAIGEALVNAGATLALSYLDDRMVRDCEALIANAPGSKLYKGNVASDDDLDALAAGLKADFGVIHGYVHSVGFAPPAELKNPFRETTRDGFGTAMDISVYSLIATSQRIVPLMTEGGSIITLTYLGADRAFPQYNVMGVAKAALEASVRYLAFDLGKDGIRVNAISAGPIKTAAARGIPGLTDMVKYFQQVAPIGAPFGAKNVADTALFLASDLSSAISGETIFVDNGFHAVGMMPLGLED
ncbi:MAG: enoyl-ACP reductase [Thermomicrobiales bacterium]|nr:enoyl-ACP reductase [Thermomicrobiales bacterium]